MKVKEYMRTGFNKNMSVLSNREKETLLKTRLRNLQRKYDRVSKETNIVDEELLVLKSEISSLEKQIE